MNCQWTYWLIELQSYNNALDYFPTTDRHELYIGVWLHGAWCPITQTDRQGFLGISNMFCTIRITQSEDYSSLMSWSKLWNIKLQTGLKTAGLYLGVNPYLLWVPAHWVPLALNLVSVKSKSAVTWYKKQHSI